MSCDNCDKEIRYTCGKKVNARCVDYEGDHSECSELNCCDKPTVHDTLEDISNQLTTICQSIDVSALGEDCLNYEGTPVTVKDVLLKLEQEVCDLKDRIQEEENCPTVFQQDISCLNLNYECLSDPCGDPPSNLTELLQSMITQICANVAQP